MLWAIHRRGLLLLVPRESSLLQHRLSLPKPVRGWLLAMPMYVRGRELLLRRYERDCLPCGYKYATSAGEHVLYGQLFEQLSVSFRW